MTLEVQLQSNLKHAINSGLTRHTIVSANVAFRDQASLGQRLNLRGVFITGMESFNIVLVCLWFRFDDVYTPSYTSVLSARETCEVW